MDDELQNVLFVLEELTVDDTVPRNVKTVVTEVMEILKGDDEFSVQKNKALQRLEELNSDSNLKSYTRSQIWDVLSMLEGL